MKPLGVPELIQVIAPYMSELTHLREDVVRLRVEKRPSTPTLTGLMADTPITVRRDDDGRWSSSIRVGDQSTGVSGCETDVDAFKRSIWHLADLLATAWTEDDE